MDAPTYRSYFSAIMPYFMNFHVTITDTVEDASENKVALWAKSTGKTDIGEYANEYMLVFYFDAEGKKIVRSLEFVDSAVTKPYMIELSNYIKEKKGSDGFEKRYGN
jgi:ketosteroid isomerase-like protein